MEHAKSGLSTNKLEITMSELSQDYDMTERDHDYQQKQLEEERLAHQLELLLFVHCDCSPTVATSLASELGIRNEFLKRIGASK